MKYLHQVVRPLNEYTNAIVIFLSFRNPTKALKNEIDKLKQEELRLDNRKDKIQTDIETFHREFATKDAEFKSIQKEGGGVRGAINAVLNLKESVPGIYGYAAQLGTPDERYEKALETAAGNRLLNIVVDNEDTAYFTDCRDYYIILIQFASIA